MIRGAPTVPRLPEYERVCVLEGKVRRLCHSPRFARSARWLSITLLLLATSFGAADTTRSSLTPGTPAPAFALLDIGRKQVRLADLRGQIVVLNFWAFWRDTWKAEMPHLQELASQQEELGFRLIAISVDGTRLPEFRKRADGGKMPFPVLMDVGGQVSARYNIAHVPTVVIIDRAGRVRYTATGYPGNHVLLRELRKLASTGGADRGPLHPFVAGGGC